MSNDKERQSEGGGAKSESAEAVADRRSLSDRASSAWRGLRPALEVGAADSSYVASMELAAEDKVCVSLSVVNPRALEEDRLADVNAKKAYGA